MPKTFYFGSFEVDADRLVLRKDGMQLPVRPKALLLLLQFLERPGELIGKSELFSSLWANVNVEQNSLSVLMAALRKVLEDGVDGSQYITTIPGQGYRFTATVRSIDGKGVSEGKRAAKTLAILPFTGLDLGTFTGVSPVGLADSLISSLSLQTSLSIKPTWSVLRLEETFADISALGAALEVDLLLVGVIRRLGDVMRISAQLVMMSTTSVIWAHQFDLSLLDTEDPEAAMRDSLIAPLIIALQDDLGKAEGTAAEAADVACANGRSLLEHRTDESITAAIKSFEFALTEKSDALAAQVGLADAFNLRNYYHFGFPTRNSARAMHWARAAARADTKSAAAQASLGFSHFLSYEFEEADRAFRWALKLDREYIPAVHWYSNMLAASTQVVAGAKIATQLADSYPLSALLRHNAAYAIYHAGQVEESLDHAQRAADLDSLNPQCFTHLAIVASQLERHDLAISSVRRVKHLSPNSDQSLSSESYVLARAGQTKKARAILTSIYKSSSYIPSDLFVLPELALDDREAALRWLARSFAERSAWSVFAGTSPTFAALREHMEFSELLADVGLPLNMAEAVM